MGRISFTAKLDEAEGPLLLSRERGVSRQSFLRFVAANPDLPDGALPYYLLKKGKAISALS